jgi:hypothetical protein
MGQFAQIREQFINAACREDAYEELLGDHAWYSLEYLIALADILLEEVSLETRQTVEERTNRMVLHNRYVMKQQRARAVGA